MLKEIDKQVHFLTIYFTIIVKIHFILTKVNTVNAVNATNNFDAVNTVSL